MRCLAPTTCVGLSATTCSDLKATVCNPCPADERPPKPCDQATASGGEGTTRTRHDLGPVAGAVTITYDMFTIPDRLDCYYRCVLVATTGDLVSGAGSLQWTYDPQTDDPLWCLVVMSAPTSGTAWVYTLGCPE